MYGRWICAGGQWSGVCMGGETEDGSMGDLGWMEEDVCADGDMWVSVWEVRREDMWVVGWRG